MAVSTEKLIPGVLPPKEETEGIDFLDILDHFDPGKLSKDVLALFAKRNPYVTACDSEIEYYAFRGNTYLVPDVTAESRMRSACITMESDRDTLLEKIANYEDGRPNGYKNCRMALIKAIGSKVCAFIVEKELEALSPEARQQQKKDFERWEIYAREAWQRREEEKIEMAWYYDPLESLSEKIVKVRKGVKNSSGKYFAQRDFAKLIGYPIPKYCAAEKYGDKVDDKLLDKLIMICHANPYYLYDEYCEAYMGEYGGSAVEEGDAPAVIVNLDVIYKWIREGRPRITSWEDSIL